MSVRPSDAGSLKVGSYVVIDNHPCKIVELEKSKTGKHGSAKVRIVGISLLDGSKHTLTAPSGALVQVPIVEKKPAQVIALLGDSIQLMDLKTYEVYEISLPEDEKVKSKLEPGVEVEVWEVLGKRFIARVL